MINVPDKPMSIERVQINGEWFDKITIDRVTVKYEKSADQKAVQSAKDASAESRPGHGGVRVS